MNILISNDDGIFAPGLVALVSALREIAQVTVVAPESERSGFSSALTLDRPLRPVEISANTWSLNGTPADCVYLATNGLFNHEFDLVVSGINSGPNIGDDVLYSGTVGAALEGRALRYPALAISLAGPNVKSYRDPIHYEKAANWVKNFIAQGLPTLPQGHILNINIPDVEEYAGMYYTYQSQRKLLQPLIEHADPRSRKIFWIGLASQEIEQAHLNHQGLYSDFYAIQHNFVSVTPIQIDHTNYDVLADLNQSK